MTKWMEKVYRNTVWILISVLLAGYFFYRTLNFTGSLQATLEDWRTWVHLAFVIFLNVTMVSGAYDVGSNTGLTSKEFELADELNNKIVTQVNNNMQWFREYIKRLNDHELQSIREDYLFSVGDKRLDELTSLEVKRYHKLKPIRHNIYGFNLPLYYEISRNGKIEYRASIRKNEGKAWSQVKRAFMGLLFGAMTVNMVFSLESVWDAFISVLVIASGLIATFMLIFFPQVLKFKFEIPKKVMLKNTLYKSYEEFRDGKVQLKTLKDEERQRAIDQVFVIQT
jgi:hypothetical protein